MNFFDNAEAYAGGESERIMGEAIKQLEWPRHSYVISTKLFWGIHGGVNMSNTLNRKYLLQAIEGSLERLDLEFVDLLYCHRADPNTPIEETVWAMSDIVASGQATYWGTSEWTADEIRAAWEIADRHHLHKPVVEQPEYNILRRRRVEREYARLYEDIGLGLTTWSPLASGLLTGKYLDGVPDDSRATLPGYEWLREMLTDPASNAKVRKLQSIAERAGLLARPALARLVRQEPARLVGDHRREPSRAGDGQPRCARRALPARRRADAANEGRRPLTPPRSFRGAFDPPEGIRERRPEGRVRRVGPTGRRGARWGRCRSGAGGRSWSSGSPSSPSSARSSRGAGPSRRGR